MDNNYALKSSREDIVAAIKKTCCLIGEEEDAANTILKYCPKFLYRNVDEIINKESLTEIPFEIETSGGYFTETVSSVQKLFYNDLPAIIIMVGICKEFKGDYGFAWLHSFFM